MTFPRADYQALTKYEPGRRPAEVDLSDNTNLWGPHPDALARIRAASADDVRCYPEVYADTLRAAVAERFGVPIECVTTGAGSYTTTSSPFRVNVPGQVPSITDVSPSLVPPGATTAMTVTGSGFAGGGVVVTGPGATVTNPVIDPSGTTIGFDLTLAADAPAENRAVIVVTENGTARCGIASDPSPPPFLPAKLVKTGAVFLVPALGFRLFVFEFSESPLFPVGLRTVSIADPDGTLVLSRLHAVDIERAFRERHRGWVRLRAVTPTNRIAASVAEPIRR